MCPKRETCLKKAAVLKKLMTSLISENVVQHFTICFYRGHATRGNSPPPFANAAGKWANSYLKRGNVDSFGFTTGWGTIDSLENQLFFPAPLELGFL